MHLRACDRHSLLTSSCKKIARADAFAFNAVRARMHCSPLRERMSYAMRTAGRQLHGRKQLLTESCMSTTKRANHVNQGSKGEAATRSFSAATTVAVLSSPSFGSAALNDLSCH